ncbi:MAG: hypothetical protein WBH08_03825 [Methanothrix sp.]|uniref:hypothetical protein n=1 Tax=Methanothrix sp. TaxID=90426 RepID=UPI003BB6B6FC
MGRQCTVCGHKDVEEINKLLLCSDSYRDIARQFGLSKDALARHKESHMPELLLKSQEVKETLQADNLLDQIVYYESEARRFKGLAESQGDLELALKAVDRALKCLDLFAKARGIISDQPQVNILVLPEWIALRTAIIQSLRPYPDALEALRDALR